MPVKLLILIPILFSLSCSNAPKAEICQEPDWYELGRLEGAQGKAIQKQKDLKKRTCEETTAESGMRMYYNGHSAGLVEFCQPQNGFELGREGREYVQVCPPELESKFLRNYIKGQKVRRLKEANRDMDEKISLLFQEINQSPIEQRKSKREDLAKLRREKTAILREVDLIEEDFLF